MNANIETTTRELTADELELVSGGGSGVIIDYAYRPAYPPGPTIIDPNF